MALITLNLPPGLYKNGAPLSKRGRYEDGNLMRWHDDSARPIGGWIRRVDEDNVDIPSLIADPDDEAVRDIFSWRGNSLAQNTIFGSNLGVYHLDSLGVVTDVTPGGYAAVNATKDPLLVAGYGQAGFGFGVYGAANNIAAVDAVPPDRWYFTNYGEVLIFGSRSNGSMYELDLGTLTSSVVTNAPSNVQAAIVSADRRQIMAIGGGGNPRRVQTSDIEGRTTWTPATTNQCIDRVLPGSGRLLNLVNVRENTLIIGEEDAFIARYIGPPYVYSIKSVGTKCGAICPEAVVSIGDFAAWWGERNFWIYSDGLQVLPCDIIDFVVKDRDMVMDSKISTFTNTDFQEVWWLYQSQSSATGECDSYVYWNYSKNYWNCGRINRTAGCDKGTLVYPVMVDPDGYIYNHELDDTFPDGSPYYTTGPIRIGEGDKNTAVRYIYADTETTNDVSFELIGKQFPSGTEHTYGPYVMNNPTPTRAQGRSIKLKVNMLTSQSEAGTMQLDIAPIGTGKR